MTTLLEPATTLLATFLGACLAFLTERRQRSREQHEANRTAGQRALFVLFAQYGELRDVLDQHLEPRRAHPVRWLLPAAHVPSGAGLVLDYSSLMFMLKGETADIVNRLMVGERKFLSAMETLQAHRRLNDEFQREVETAIPNPGETFEVAQIEAAIGHRLVRQLQDTTDGLYAGIDSAIAMNQENFQILRAALQKLFPGERFINLILLPPAGQ